MVEILVIIVWRLNNMVNEEFIGNFTSIVKTVLLAFAGYFIGYCVSIGLNLPITAEQLSEVLFMVLCLVWSYFDMKYPNAFKWFKNNPAVESFESEADLINEEYYAEEEYE